MQAITKPLLAPILDILIPIGANFDVKNAVLGGIDFMKKVGNIFSVNLLKNKHHLQSL